MPACKDESRGTWFCSFRVKDCTGRVIQKKKRGFKTKKEAEEYEREALQAYNGDMGMSLASFVEIYLDDARHNLKASTCRLKERLIKTKLLPTFGEKPMMDIDANMVRTFKNNMADRCYSSSYQRGILTQLSAIMNFAVRLYHLKENPVPLAGVVKQEYKDHIVWTEETFKAAVSHENKDMYVALWYVLFYGGLRIGEALALTEADISDSGINVNKTITRFHKQDYITAPKTQSSIRIVGTPSFVIAIVRAYIAKMYAFDHVRDRVFPVTYSSVKYALKKLIRDSGVPKITPHGFRHSYATMLIHRGAAIPDISKQLGHENTAITMETYTHAYDDAGRRIAAMLDEPKKPVAKMLPCLNGYMLEASDSKGSRVSC